MFEGVRKRLNAIAPAIPSAPVEPGYNTKQMLNHGYRFWHEMFNARQLLALTILAKSIQGLPVGNARSALALLFSGAFSTLYRSRLLRAMDYRASPFEIAVENAGRRKSGRKVFGISEPIDLDVLVICRKKTRDRRPRRNGDDALSVAAAEGTRRVRRFNTTGRQLSRNDVGVVLLSLLLVELSAGRSADQVVGALDGLMREADALIETAWRSQSVQTRATEGVQQARSFQLTTPS